MHSLPQPAPELMLNRKEWWEGCEQVEQINASRDGAYSCIDSYSVRLYIRTGNGLYLRGWRNREGRDMKVKKTELSVLASDWLTDSRPPD